MKKLFVLLFTISLSLCILACGGNNKSSSSNKATNDNSGTSAAKQIVKPQKLDKLVPIAKLLVLNENELREIEKTLTALDINFDNIHEWKETDDFTSVPGSNKSMLIKLLPGKDQSFDTLRPKLWSEILLTFSDKKLTAVKFYTGTQDTLYYKGKIYNKISDYLIADKVRDKAIQTAFELFKKTEMAKNISDLKIKQNGFNVYTYSKLYEDYIDNAGHRRTSNEWYYTDDNRSIEELEKGKPTDYSQFITGYVLYTGKEKFYGGENVVEVCIQNLHFDIQGNFVDTGFSASNVKNNKNGKIENIPGTGKKGISQQAPSTETNNGTKNSNDSKNTTTKETENNSTKNNSNTATQSSAPSITKNAIVSAKHSSADNEDGYNHSAALTTDGDTKTCWAEGVPGLGIGENLTYYFDGNYKVSGLNIWTGHQKTEDLFYKNARPVAIRVIGSDGSNVIYSLNDAMGMQRITFNAPITINNIKLVVEKVVPGNKYEDTCIAEVNFF